MPLEQELQELPESYIPSDRYKRTQKILGAFKGLDEPTRKNVGDTIFRGESTPDALKSLLQSLPVDDQTRADLWFIHFTPTAPEPKGVPATPAEASLTDIGKRFFSNLASGATETAVGEFPTIGAPTATTKAPTQRSVLGMIPPSPGKIAAQRSPQVPIPNTPVNLTDITKPQIVTPAQATIGPVKEVKPIGIFGNEIVYDNGTGRVGSDIELRVFGEYLPQMTPDQRAAVSRGETEVPPSTGITPAPYRTPLAAETPDELQKRIATQEAEAIRRTGGLKPVLGEESLTRVQSGYNAAYNAFTQTFAGILKSMGIAAHQLDTAFPTPSIGFTQAGPELLSAEESTGMGESVFYSMGKALSDFGNEQFKTNPKFATDFTETLAQGAGSLAAFAATSVAGRAVGASSVITTMLAGAGAQGAQAYDEATEARVPEEKAIQAWMLNLGIGASEALPVERALNRLDKVSGGYVTKWVKNRIAKGVIEGGIEEFIQELSQNLASNYVAKEFYDPERGIGDGALDQATAGGILGATMNGLMAAAGLKARLNRVDRINAIREFNAQIAALDAKIAAIEKQYGTAAVVEEKDQQDRQEPKAPIFSGETQAPTAGAAIPPSPGSSVLPPSPAAETTPAPISPVAPVAKPLRTIQLGGQDIVGVSAQGEVVMKDGTLVPHSEQFIRVIRENGVPELSQPQIADIQTAAQATKPPEAPAAIMTKGGQEIGRIPTNPQGEAIEQPAPGIPPSPGATEAEPAVERLVFDENGNTTVTVEAERERDAIKMAKDRLRAEGKDPDDYRVAGVSAKIIPTRGGVTTGGVEVDLEYSPKPKATEKVPALPVEEPPVEQPPIEQPKPIPPAPVEAPPPAPVEGGYSVREREDGKFEVLNPQGGVVPRAPIATREAADAIAKKMQATFDKMTGKETKAPEPTGAAPQPGYKFNVGDEVQFTHLGKPMSGVIEYLGIPTSDTSPALYTVRTPHKRLNVPETMISGKGAATAKVPPSPGTERAPEIPKSPGAEKPDAGEIIKKALSEKPSESERDALKRKLALGPKNGVDPKAIDNFISEMKTTEGRVAAGLDPRIVKTLGGNLYTGDLGQITMREVLQNSLDAVRELQNPLEGEIRLHVNTDRKSISITDNGPGMLPEVASKELMDIGGSKKGADASGGFGIAKIAIFANASEIKIVTTAAKPGGGYTRTTLEGTGEEWIDQSVGLKITTEDLPIGPVGGTGTNINLKLNDEAKMNSYSANHFAQSAAQHWLLPFNLEIVVNDNTYEAHKPPLTLRTSVEVPGAIADIYVGEHSVPISSYGGINAEILNQGFFQFHIGAATGQPGMPVPGPIIVNVRPTGGPEGSDYPFTPDRENLRGYELQKQIAEYVKLEIVGSANQAERERYKRRIDEAPVVGSNDEKIVDTAGVLDKDLVLKLARREYLNQMMDDINDGTYFLIDTVNSKRAKDTIERPELGIGLGSSYLGINIQGKALGRKDNLLLINPYTSAMEVVNAINTGLVEAEHGPEMVAESIAATIAHEVSHQNKRGHDEEFAGELTRVLGLSIRTIARLQHVIEQILTENENAAYNELLTDLEEIKTQWGGEDIFGKISAGASVEGESTGDQSNPETSSVGEGGPRESVSGRGERPSEGVAASTGTDFGDADFTDLEETTQENLLKMGSWQYQDTPDYDAWAKAITADLGDWVTPYLPSAYDLIDNVADATGQKPEKAPAPKEKQATPPEETPDAPRPPPKAATTPMMKLAERVRDAIKAKQQLDNPTLTKWAVEEFGGTRGEGKYDPKDAYDAAEAGINMVIMEPGVVDFNDVPSTLARLRELVKLMPTQADRTSEQIDFQQFSTPPEEAFVAAKIAAIAKGMTVLEPSAGTGNIAIMAQSAGAKVVTNELSARRNEILESFGFQTNSVDALHLNSLLDSMISPDVVVMNPPFSSNAGKTSGNKTEYGAKHVEEALARVKPGGRVVAIVGRGMAHDRPGFSDWWTRIEQKYNVRANIGIDGKYYKKYGTGFDNQILVIDKTGPTPGANRSERIGNIIRGEGLSPEEAILLMDAISKEDVSGRIGEAEQTGRKPDEGSVRRPSGGRTAGAPPVDTGGSQRPGGQNTQPPTGGNPPNLPGVGPVAPTGGKLPQSPAGDAPGSDQKGGIPTSPKSQEATDVGDGHGGVDTGRDGGDRGDSDAVAKPVGEAEDDVFSKYVVRKAIIPNSVEHPANIVESTTMASVDPPSWHYTPDIEPEMISEGRISDVQLETIAYAGQRHEIMLPNGMRAGFWNGDGTGVGKGRQAAGIIVDNINRGRKRAVWFSAGQTLADDAQRDMDGIGLKVKLHRQNDSDKFDDIPDEDGVVFTTYTMASNGWKGGKERFNQLTRWMGNDFDGVIILDEAHLMKNALGTGVGGKVSQDAGTDTGAMGLTLSQMFPNARIVYFSATGATIPRNMAYMDRLGMWGPGAPFADFGEFLSAMNAGGVGAMEMLARDLKATGAFISRTISYKGVDYDTVTHMLTKEEVASYDAMADFWAEVLKKFEEAMKNSGQKRRDGNAISQFYGSMQRFFLQVMMSYQLPDLFAAVDQDIADGKSVIISLYNTNEGQVKKQVADALAAGQELDDMDFTPRELLANLVRKHFPTQEYDTVRDPATGQTTTVPMVDEHGNPVLNPENVQMQEALLDRIADMSVPQNPLDAIVNYFGPKKVSEVSGRTKRMEVNKYVTRKIKGVPIRQRDATEVKRFQDGTNRIAIITGKASTGISLHSDLKAKNQERRVFYAMQLSWSADKQMQAFGRVHRSSQANAPEIKMVRTNLRGQERLVNTISARLASLGAIAKGSRESLGGGLFQTYDVTDEYGEAALSQTYAEILKNNIPGIVSGQQLLTRMGFGPTMTSGDTTNVEKFLNRIMGLHFDEQNSVFEKFFTNYINVVEMAKEKGEFDVGVRKLGGENIRLTGQPETVYTHKASGAKTQLVPLAADFPNHPLSWQKSDRSVDDFYRHTGYVTNNRSKKIYAVKTYVHLDANGQNKIELVSPSGASHILDGSLNQAHTAVSFGDAEKLWKTEFDKVPKYRTQNVHLLTGAIYPIYNIINANNTLGFGREINRAELADGSAYVGLVIKPSAVSSLKQRLGIGSALKDLSGKELYDMIRSGSVIELDNGWRLKATKVHGEDRIELDDDHSGNKAELTKHGLIEEIIMYSRRWFVPLDDVAGPAAIDSLIELHKAVRDQTSGAQPNKPPVKPRRGSGTSSMEGDEPPDIDSEVTIEEETDEPADEENDDYVPSSPTAPPAAAGGIPPSPGRTAQVPPSPRKELIGKREILADLSKRLEVPLRSGRYRIPNALGIFKVRANVARTKRALDVPVAAHEIGHAINKILWGAGTSGQSLNWRPLAPYRTELEAIASKPRAGQSALPEGFAEFIRMYLTDPTLAQLRAPNFAKFFDNELIKNPELGEILRDAQANIRRYQAQSGRDKVRSQVSVGEKLKRETSWWHNFYDAVLDRAGPFRRLMEKLDPVPLEDDPYKLLRLHSGWTGRAEHFLNYGTFRGNKRLDLAGPSFKEILDPVKHRLEDLRTALVAWRVLEKANQGVNTGITPSVARQALGEIQNLPELRKVADELYAFQDSHLQYLVDRGVISSLDRNVIKAANQARVPFYRVMESTVGEGVDEGGFGGGKDFADLWSPIHKMFGSGRQIIDPLESIIKDTYTIINLAEKNRVGSALARLASQHPNIGGFVESGIAAKMMPIKFSLERIQTELEQALGGIDLSGVDLTALATIFSPLMRGSEKERIIVVLVNGERKLLQLAPDLYRAIKGMDEESTSKLVRLLAIPEMVLRLGATGLGPEFLIRNPARDTFTAFMQSEYGVLPFVGLIKGAKHAFTHDDTYKLWLRSGGALSSMAMQDRENLQLELRDLLATKLQSVGNHPIETARMLSSALEDSTRLGEFQAGIENGDSPEEAGYNSRNSTIDFAAGGNNVKTVSALSAFWKARMQGGLQFARSHREHFWRTFLRGVAGTTLISTILYLWNRDDPEYEELPWWLKDGFWVMSMKDYPSIREHTPFLVFPKPNLYGLVYGSIPERVMEYYDKENPKAFEGFANVLKTEAPIPVPSFLRVFGELMGNKSLLTGRPIVPTNLLDLPPEDQYLYYTSEPAKLLSKVANKYGVPVAPITIEHLFYGQTGGTGRLIVDTVNPTFRKMQGLPPSPGANLSDVPLVKALVVRPTGSEEGVQKFYERLGELEKKEAHDNAARKPNSMLKPNMTPAEREELKKLNAANEQIKVFRKVMKRVSESDATGDATERRNQINALQLKIANVSRRVMDVAEKKVPRPPLMPPSPKWKLPPSPGSTP